MKNLSIFEALGYLKENPADMNLVNAISACFDDRLDELEGIVPKNAKQAEILEEEIDALSELTDLMIAVQEECKAYSRAVKVNANADDAGVQDILLELEDYLNAYDKNYKGLAKFVVEL